MKSIQRLSPDSPAVRPGSRLGVPPMWLYLLFCGSGVSGLVYQVVWVRQFGHVFGNTIQSASIVVAVFMLGLGAGGYALGRAADRRDPSRPNSLVRMYAGLEAVIALLGLAIALTLPRLGAVVASISSYETGADGWQALSAASYVWRTAVVMLMLGPITLLMGGTLTVLVRALVSANLHRPGWRVAWLYGANTLGAAIGAFVTDFLLIPSVGIFATQMAAVAINAAAALGAYLLARSAPEPPVAVSPRRRDRQAEAAHDAGGAVAGAATGAVRWTALTLALSGFAVLGMEILWVRHLGVLLGGFRAVFSLLLTVMLVAFGIGALAGGWIDRRFGRPLRTLAIVQGLFAVAALAGIAASDAAAIATRGTAMAGTLGAMTPSARRLAELWFNLQPMIAEVALPSLIAGLSFPLANALVQHVESSIGRRAGILYAANTAGAVCGSLVTGYFLLPVAGMQTSAGVLAAVAALSLVPLSLVRDHRGGARERVAFAGAALLSAGGLAMWVALPDDYLLQRTLGPRAPDERLLTISEGLTEVLAVVERPGRGRGLLTNGHAMSSTAPLDQRYMRALAHVPLLSMERPERVLVIGFGVGNTAHAATLHTPVTRVEIVDISRHILEHARLFEDANRGVLRDGKVSVYINDGRRHLEMSARGAYDLITLEPPPVAHAGVAALYSREFYELARSRLKAGGYVSQWLPAYQVPRESSLAMVRAFLDVFPQSVLLSGAQAELLLVGTSGRRIELDPVRVADTLRSNASVRTDLERLDLGTVREIAGTFVGSASTLADATRMSPAVTDDRPLQEYGVWSGLSAGLMGVPSELFDLEKIASWCPGCVEGAGAALAAHLDLYLQLLQQAYLEPPRPPSIGEPPGAGPRRILGSVYLGAVVPDSAEVHNLLGLARMRDGEVDEAIREFEEALARDGGLASARANLGQVRYEQGAALLESRRFVEAVALLRAAIDLMPESAEAHNDIGVALASLGRVDEATEHFRRAVTLEPGFTEARENLESATRVTSR